VHRPESIEDASAGEPVQVPGDLGAEWRDEFPQFMRHITVDLEPGCGRDLREATDHVAHAGEMVHHRRRVLEKPDDVQLAFVIAQKPLIAQIPGFAGLDLVYERNAHLLDFVYVSFQDRMDRVDSNAAAHIAGSLG